ncbi:MAG: hypothetical protein Q8L78_02375 [Coxiellaceae bacterium]|nr:hypothetical protein [Coxiellaceae bacterium]
MSQINTEKNKSVIDSSVLDGQEKHFIENELFEKLLAVREEIYLKTEINVSPRKLVNMLLKKSDFEALRDQLIQQYS